MKIPFITRAHHDEVVAMLRDQVAKGDEDRKRLIDHLQLLTTGVPIYSPAPETQKPAPKAVEKPAEALPIDQATQSEVEQARSATGSRKMSVITRWISRKREREWQNRDTAVKERQKNAIASLEEAIAEGQQAAKEATA